MKKIKLGVALICVLSLASCSNSIIDYKEHLDDYVSDASKTPVYSDGFTIVQLTDLHWGTMSSIPEQKEYLFNLFKGIKAHTGRIDLIELTGDQCMFFNKNVVKDLIETLESLEIAYAPVWGNHDREGRASPKWIANQFRNAPHCLYKQVDNDNVYGASNFVINLKDSSNNVKWQIANLDSGADYTDSATGWGMTYDYIREDQAKWWKAEHDKVGDDVPVIAYYHIAQEEYYMAWDAYKDNKVAYPEKVKFFKYEGFGGSSKNNIPYFFNEAKDHGLKGVFVGHAHSCDWTIDYQNITLGFGVKTGKELYYAKITKEDANKVGISEGFDLVGASVVTLHDSKEFDLEHFYFDNAGLNEWVVY